MKRFDPTQASCQELIEQLSELADENYLAGMKRFAIENKTALGVKLPFLREFAKPLKKRSDRHTLAMELWSTAIHEARILASIIANPKLLTESEMNTWVNDFYSWDVCDQCCSNLFQKTSYFLTKSFEYSKAEAEFVKRCGFTLMAQYAQHHKKAPDTICLQFLERIEEEAYDARNFVKKAVNWALREIGKRNESMLLEAEACAYRLVEQPHASAKWIARDALREFAKQKQ